VRADEQKLDSRRSGRTRAHESTKSISIKAPKRKSSGCALTAHGLTPGGLRCVLSGHIPKGTERQVIVSDRTVGVSRGHSRRQEALKA
jgi:hypothetical protein